mgnify:CR=1 FL=1
MKRTVKDLKFDKRNANKHSEYGMQRLEKSIQKIGLGRSILISDDNEIIAGNGVTESAINAGIEKVRVIETDGTEIIAVKRTDIKSGTKEFYEMALSDNIIAKENIVMDAEVTNAICEEYEIEEYKIEEEGKHVEAEENDFAVPNGGIETDIVLGDLFEIGEHRLLCGDSTDSDQVEKLMNGEKAELVLTDPPYSSGGSQESGKTSGSIGARGGHTIKNDNLSTRGYKLLMQDVLSLCNEAHSIFVFCDWKMWIETFDISERAGFRVRNMIVWDKMQMGMGMPFRNQHELCLFASKIAGKIGDGATPNVLQHKRDREAEHKTPKPIELLSDLLKQIQSNNVFDPFLGGGSTMVASHQLNRKCYGMELDPKYCQVIVDRMLKLDPTLEVKRNGLPYKAGE